MAQITFTILDEEFDALVRSLGWTDIVQIPDPKNPVNGMPGTQNIPNPVSQVDFFIKANIEYWLPQSKRSLKEVALAPLIQQVKAADQAFEDAFKQKHPELDVAASADAQIKP